MKNAILPSMKDARVTGAKRVRKARTGTRFATVGGAMQPRRRKSTGNLANGGTRKLKLYK